MSDMNEFMDVLTEIRDILEDIRIQNDIAVKFIVRTNSKNFQAEEKITRYKLKIMQEIKEEEDE